MTFGAGWGSKMWIYQRIRKRELGLNPAQLSTAYTVVSRVHERTCLCRDGGLLNFTASAIFLDVFLSSLVPLPSTLQMFMCLL